MTRFTSVRCALAAAIGLAVSSAHPLGIAFAIAMPAVVLRQPTRRTSYAAATFYYGAALWSLIPGANNFFGPDVSAFVAFALWAVAVLALASPWPLLWTRFDSRDPGRAHPSQFLWRAPLTMFLTVIPPLGIIGWASPLIASGFLFPGTAWCGLVGCALASGALAAWPRSAAAATATLALCTNLIYPAGPRPLAGWQGINTQFGAISHGVVSPLAEYQAAEQIHEAAISSSASVIVFPETVVPAWTASTDAFWQPTLDRLRASGKTILIGARLPVAAGRPETTPRFNFSADLAALEEITPPRSVPALLSQTRSQPHPLSAYRNVVIIRGADQGTFQQHIPVPVAMWNPFRSATAPINLFGPGILHVRGERAAILICYEQLLVWPVLNSIIERPTILIAVANDHWATNTTIPQFQLSAVRAWSRLFRLPYVSAVNT